MVVCHCEAVNDAAIRSVISEDAAVREVTVEEIAAKCGAGGRCGGCHDTIRSIIDRLAGVPAESPVRAVGSRRSLRVA